MKNILRDSIASISERSLIPGTCLFQLRYAIYGQSVESSAGAEIPRNRRKRCS